MSIDYKQLQAMVKEAMFTGGGINEPSAPEGIPHRMPAANSSDKEQDMGDEEANEMYDLALVAREAAEQLVEALDDPTYDQAYEYAFKASASLRKVLNSLEETGAHPMPIRTLPPHPDVAHSLQRLKDAGFRMVTLTNSSNAAVEAQMRNAGLTDMFDERLSVEDIGLYKPHEHAYRWAARRMGVPASECMLIAAHGWDIAGALWAGWRGAFLARPGAQLYPLADSPEIVVPTLTGAADQLIEMRI